MHWIFNGTQFVLACSRVRVAGIRAHFCNKGLYFQPLTWKPLTYAKLQRTHFENVCRSIQKVPMGISLFWTTFICKCDHPILLLNPTAHVQLMTAESTNNFWSITWKFTSRIPSYFFYNWTSREKSAGDKNYDQ